MDKQYTFEDFLMEEHAAEYIGPKHAMVDAINDWLCRLDVDDWIKLGDKFKSQYAQNPTVNRRAHLALEAVKGLSDEDLEAGAVGKLVEALLETKDYLESMGDDEIPSYKSICKALKPWEVKT